MDTKFCNQPETERQAQSIQYIYVLTPSHSCSPKRNHYPLTVMEDLLLSLRKAKLFTLCDVNNEYRHVELQEDSSYLTTFATPFGRHRWLRLPFGISPAPEYFQRHLDQALENFPGVKPVWDDILIYGEGDIVEEAEEDHDRKFKNFLDRCRAKNIKLNPTKMRLKMTELPFMGHLLTTEGLKPDPSKVEALKKMEKPNDIQSVRPLIGMVNYLPKFLKNLADLYEQLRKLTHKDSTWNWTEEHDQVFEKIKEAFISTPVY